MPELILQEKSHSVELPLRLEPSPTYPDVRFHCPFCGSLDVYLNTDGSAVILSMCCLDCKKNGAKQNDTS